MRLISLSANKDTFKTIIFHKSGASFILAEQKNPEQHDNNKTYNGVGKSLLIALIDFCLGARRNKFIKSLQNKIADWHFILNIEIKNQNYQIARYVNAPEKITLNNEQLLLSDFLKKLADLCFDIPADFQYLSFRALLPFFLRPSKKSYLNYYCPIDSAVPLKNQ